MAVGDFCRGDMGLKIFGIPVEGVERLELKGLPEPGSPRCGALVLKSIMCPWCSKTHGIVSDCLPPKDLDHALLEADMLGVPWTMLEHTTQFQ